MPRGPWPRLSGARSCRARTSAAVVQRGAATAWLSSLLLLLLMQFASPVVMDPPLRFPDDFGPAPTDAAPDQRMHLAARSGMGSVRGVV
ncbi:hypothetical protein T484DRAFT_1801837 [Baffinella frigidus]|nr:hypothetical protein T484DRAFT_1801837 [Cryptophyta sp. CCMP2293]